MAAGIFDARFSCARCTVSSAVAGMVRRCHCETRGALGVGDEQVGRRQAAGSACPHQATGARVDRELRLPDVERLTRPRRQNDVIHRVGKVSTLPRVPRFARSPPSRARTSRARHRAARGSDEIIAHPLALVDLQIPSPASRIDAFKRPNARPSSWTRQAARRPRAAAPTPAAAHSPRARIVEQQCHRATQVDARLARRGAQAQSSLGRSRSFTCSVERPASVADRTAPHVLLMRVRASKSYRTTWTSRRSYEWPFFTTSRWRVTGLQPIF